MGLLVRGQLRRLLDEHQVSPSRALGQNFVAEPNTVRQIARLARVGPGDQVLEIGAGLGSLTLALAETGAQVTALEVDKRLIPILSEVVAGLPGVRVVHADATRLDWPSFLAEHAGPERPGPERARPEPAGLERARAARPGPEHAGPERPNPGRWILVANLPYNLATPLVADLLDQVPAIVRMLIMVQREVGERLAAKVGDPGYGAVSVKVAYWATAAIVARIPPSVFVPRPRVESVLVAIDRRPEPSVSAAVVSPEALFEVVRAGFAQRRKMLRRALAGTAGAEAFREAGVSPEARAEDLDVAAWGRLAEAVVAGA